MSTSKKDPRRADLAIPYTDPAKSKDADSSPDMSSTMSSTLPMAAIFTRNKMLAWTAVLFGMQTWLNETPAQKETASTPAYFSVGMALLAVGVSYMPLFMPPQPGRGMGTTGTEAPSAVPS